MIFKHSGDLGDIIYSLPTIRAMGGGRLVLDPTGGRYDKAVVNQNGLPTRLDNDSAYDIKLFLERQPYIEAVDVWNFQGDCVNLNKFRNHLNWKNLADAHLDAFDLPHSHRDTAWLVHPESWSPKRIVLHRSLRTGFNDEFWRLLDFDTCSQAMIVGFKEEALALREIMRHRVPWYQTDSIYDLAAIISGCDKFIGNQSLPLAIAEGFKKNIIYEVYKPAPSNLFDREGLVCI